MSCRSSLRAASAALLLTLAAAQPGAASGAVALPDAVSALLSQPRLVGQGTLRWLGLHVYDAALWSGGAALSADVPFALDIRYARRIAGATLAATSVEEMQRMGFGDPEALQRWRREMERIFPDVAPGDRLIGVSLPGRGAAFYSGRRQLGRIDDAEFARAFFSIWLGDRARESGLRSALLGNRADSR